MKKLRSKAKSIFKLPKTWQGISAIIFSILLIGLNFLRLTHSPYPKMDLMYVYIPETIILIFVCLLVWYLYFGSPELSKLKVVLAVVALLISAVALAFFEKKPPTTGDWQAQLAIPSIAEFNGDQVTIKNVRNFRYGPEDETIVHPNYYNHTYDLSKLTKVWYITEPFKGEEYAGHTFLSYEFSNGDFVSITIEGRKTYSQHYHPIKGQFKYYPLIYIAADERDTVLLRANLRKDEVFVYPVKVTPEKGRALFVDMLNRMNDLQKNPVWYNTIFDSCTTAIVYHVNRISPGTIPASWQLIATGYADQLALKLGLVDTELNIEQARAKYIINEKSEKAGDTPNYSKLIREGLY